MGNAFGMFNGLFLLGLILFMFHCQCFSLDQVPVDLLVLNNETNRDICVEASSSVSPDINTEDLCGRKVSYPNVKSFCIEDKFCLRKRNESLFRLVTSNEREHKEVNLTGCVVGVYNKSGSNISCQFTTTCQHLSQQYHLNYLVLNCSTQRKRYCLNLSLQAKLDNLTKCNKIPLTTVSTSYPATPTSGEKVTLLEKIRNFVDNKPFVIVPVVVGLILCGILIVVCTSWRCYKRRKKSSSSQIDMDQLRASAQDKGFSFKGSANSIVYLEPDSGHVRCETAPDVADKYDYPYEHFLRSHYGKKRNGNEGKPSDGERFAKDQNERSGYCSLKRHEEDDNEYKSLTGNEDGGYVNQPRTSPAKKEQDLPIYYVKVL